MDAILNEKFCIVIRISLKLIPIVPIDNKSILVQVMAWRRSGLLTHICGTRVKYVYSYYSFSTPTSAGLFKSILLKESVDYWNQCHCYWWHGDEKNQSIGGHGINLVIPEYSIPRHSTVKYFNSGHRVTIFRLNKVNTIHYDSLAPRAPSQNPKRRISVRSRKISKPRDLY